MAKQATQRETLNPDVAAILRDGFIAWYSDDDHDNDLFPIDDDDCSDDIELSPTRDDESALLSILGN